MKLRVRNAGYEGLCQPKQNSFFPKKFEVLPDSGDSEIKRLFTSKSHIVWYGKDNHFKQPKTYVNLDIYTTDINFNKTIESSIFLKIWLKLV